MNVISVVMPVYNEEKNISVVYKEIKKVFDQFQSYDCEIIFVNDGSKDKSWQTILDISSEDKKVKGINFGRNFGHQIALKAGYDFATGDAVITMDSDMQHPPGLIPKILECWKNGVDVVYVRQKNRSGGFLKKITSILFYKILDFLTDISIPRNVGDFRLIDKKVLMELKKFKGHTPYLRGIFPWMGFGSSFIDVEYGERFSGTTGYSWTKMFKLAFDGIVSLSFLPLKIASIVGVFVILSGMFMFLYITLDAFINNVRYPLFKWLITIMYIFIGVLFILIWILGEYIGRIYEETKNYPLYVVSEAVNIENERE